MQCLFMDQMSFPADLKRLVENQIRSFPAVLQRHDCGVTGLRDAITELFPELAYMISAIVNSGAL